MSVHSLGKIGLNICGNFSEETSYSKLDIVFYNGSSYVAMDDCVGVKPDALVENPWVLLARGTVEDAQEITLGFDSDAKFTVRSDNPLEPTLRVSGHVVELHAELQPTASITGGTTYYPICTLPEAYIPHHDVCVLQQGSTQQIWMLRIYGRNNTENMGKVMFSRCRSGNSWSNASTSTWLPLHATWIV